MPTADIDTLLIFRIATIACAVPAQEVDSIVMPPPHLTHPPGSSEGAPGIFQYHRQVHAVIDLHQRFGIDIPRQGQGRLLLHHDDGGHYALWVDEVLGLVRSEQGQWAPLPPYLPRALFWSGFLYQKEIVLCSRLEALRRMQDASPLHIHLAELRKTQPTWTEAKEPPASATVVATGKKSPAAPHAEEHRPKTILPPATAKTAPAEAKPIRVSHPAEPPARRPAPLAAAQPPRAPRAPLPPHRPAAPPLATTAGKPQQPQHPPPRPGTSPLAGSAPPRAPVAPEEQAAPPPVESPSAMGAWLVMLLVAFGAGGTYWLWSGSEPVTPPRPEQTPPHRKQAAAAPIEMPSARNRPPAPQIGAPAAERETPTPANVPPLAANEVPSSLSEQPAQTAETAPPEQKPTVLGKATTTEGQGPEPPSEAAPTSVSKTPEEKPAEPPTAPPLRIERDSEDTLNLIIDRAAVGKAEPQPAPVSGQAVKEGPTMAGTEARKEEEPLQPEADWPSPVPPEPCECLHVVVKGDTLWDIAERYTHNAFNYPELARRSGIRNPDLIYPGDKVRIIVR